MTLKKERLSLFEGLKLLHARDENDQLHVGVDAFILIWKQLKRRRIFAALVGLPIIRQTTNVAYRVFANCRFKQLEHCQLAAKQEALS